MATRRTRRTAASLTTLVLRTRRAVGDIVDDAAPSAGDRKWEDTAIVEAINDMMAEMYQEFFTNPDQVVLETSLTYTGGSDEVEYATNDASQTPIYGIFETVNGVRTLLRHVDYLTIQRYDTEGADPANETERVWCQRDEYVLLRPVPANDVTLTVAYIGAPFGMDAAIGADNHPLPVAHEELLVIGAANRLQYPNDQLPIGRQRHYDRLWQKWQQDCDRYQGPRFPADTRRYRL